MAEEKAWQGTTFGTVRMHSMLISALRWMPLWFVYLGCIVLVIPVCLLINTNQSRTHSWHFYRLHMGYGLLKSAWNVYLNHCLFSQVVVDKFAMYAGRKFHILIDGYDEFLAREASPDGFVQLSAHIGNYEVAGYSLVARNKRFNALIFAGEKASVIENRQKMFQETNIRMIPIRADLSHLFTVNEALASGETVSIAGDRMNGSPKTLQMPFLGSPAYFPLGPFSVPTMRSLETVAVNVMKEGLSTYHIYVTPLHYDHSLPRLQQEQQLARSYAAELERIVRLYPHQWYNFYDFWNLQ